ncbi:MAG: PKD domain-containing protein, partial [Bacteroidales bacterium]|nr:PKD domain-containing protein [Bacteroidales bacterium]
MNTYFRYNILVSCLLFYLLVFNVLGQSRILMSDSQHDSHEHIFFIENKRQWDERIKFKSEMRGGALFFESNGITGSFIDPDYLEKIQALKSGSTTVVLDSLATYYAYRMNFLGANRNTVIKGFQPMEQYYNYYIGSDSTKWASNVKKYEQIRYEQLYPGIDLLFYEEYHTYKYEFVVEKGVDPSLIRLQYEGVDRLSLKKKNLSIKVGKQEIMERRPFAYQISERGERQVVACDFVLDGKVVYFSLGKYDPNRELVIDPTLIFASFSGSTADNWGYTATYDNAGNLYGGGTVYSTGYPVTLGVFQQSYGGGTCDIGITKFNSNGTQAIFATYLGGSGADAPHSLIVNENDELYVLSTTSASNFPVTQGAYDVTFNGGTYCLITGKNEYYFGSDVAISRFNASGTQLLSSTYFGGSGNDGLNLALVYNYADEIRGEIELDNSGNVYIVSSTNSLNLPVTAGAFQTTYGGGRQDGFIAKFSYNLQQLIWCSYFGGDSSDAIYSMELDNSNNVYICGGTLSSNLPTSAGVVSPSPLGERDGFIAKIAANGRAVQAATYYGRDGYDQTYLLAIDKDEEIVVVGQTTSAAANWVSNATWYNGSGQFISKLSNDLTQVIWSTSFGSVSLLPNISPTALMVDICNNIHISGWGGTTGNILSTFGLPVTANALQRTTDGSDFYFMSLDANASNLVYATFFGGMAGEHVDGGTSRFDKKGCIYQAVCAGCGGNSSFPVTPGVVSQTNNSYNCNLGVIKLDFNLQTVISDFSMPSVVCVNVEIAFENRSKGISDTTHYFWDFGDGTTDTAQNPTHIYLAPGSYDITLIVSDYSSCNIADTLTKTILVGNNQSTVIPEIELCKGESAQIGIRPSSDPDIRYEWYPFRGINSNDISNPIFMDTVSRQYILIVATSVCVDTFFQQINVIDIPLGENMELLGCLNDTLHFIKDTFQMDSYIWSSDVSFSDTLNVSITNPYLDVILNQSTSVYYLQRTKSICTVLDTLQLNASSFQLEFEIPKICHGDSVRLNMALLNPQFCSSFIYYWEPVADIIGDNQIALPLVYPDSAMYFNVLVTNEHNCSVLDSVFVNVIKLKSDITSNSISCYGMSDGMILMNMSGGESPYTYQWKHTTDDTAYLDSLQEGLYSVTIMDSNHCSMDTSIQIIEPSVLFLTLQSIIDTVYCNDICNGEALAIVSGGTVPYSFGWITGDTAAHIDNLCAGEYSLLLTDA